MQLGCSGEKVERRRRLVTRGECGLGVTAAGGEAQDDEVRGGVAQGGGAATQIGREED